jgi:uroporphyrinogen decarboxylase
MMMNDRQRFNATMHYQPRDRSPICDFGFWPECIEEWHKQGLPDWVTGGHDTTYTDQFFGMDKYSGGPQVRVGLCPGFEEKVIEDRGDHEVMQDSNGVILLRKKYMGSIPMHLGHTLVDRASWEKHYKWRLDPSNPKRYPDWEQAKKVWDDPNCPYPRTFGAGSLFGWIRDWMGMENVAFLTYDDPALFEEMVTTIADCIVEVHRRAFERGAKIDAAAGWEDMCYNSGPLLAPDKFKKYLVPHYKRISEQLRRNGVDIFWTDCDGCIDDLLPMWLDAGVNCMFPIEIGTWGADPVKYRKQYGKELRMMGGFDKHILAKTKRDIEEEIMRLAPLVEEGGFIGFADHRVPPDVPLENYMFYMETVRRVWGKGANLKPLGKLVAPKSAK